MSDFTSAPSPLWQPSAALKQSSKLRAFIQFLSTKHRHALPDYAALHAWSIAEPADFWRAVWDFGLVIGSPGDCVLEEGDKMPGARWFPQARLNFARNLLRRQDQEDALIFCGEEEVHRRVSHSELHREVARLAAALRGVGVGVGDRVAAYMPNMPQTMIAMLATASIGAVFASASPDFGVQAVLDRFGQIAPKVLIAADGVLYAGKRLDAMARVAAIAAGLPSVSEVVIVPYIHAEHDLSAIRGAQMWADFVCGYEDVWQIDFVELPFDAPLYILFSSGTTGVPKCIVHSAGGTLLQHIKEHQLHADIRPNDRVFYFTTCGWMMWNWLLTALASDAVLLLYDGSPFANEGRLLWDFVAAERCTHFGTSAKYLDAAERAGLRPVHSHQLDDLRVVLSTGSPLSPEGFAYVYRDIKADVCLSSISGGTDIVSCFVLGSPILPVWAGQIQCAGLGMAVEVFDEAGRPLASGKGELVCTQPFPSMPLGFWNDASGERYRAAYFERFAGVWCHGDWCERTAQGGYVIHGRSDATLNPGGVRIGTAEIYRQLEGFSEIEDAVVIGQAWQGDVRVLLFVRLTESLLLSDDLVARIKAQIRQGASPRHVPARIVQVGDVPRTRNGKLVELAVRATVQGEAVSNIESIANPEALAHYKARPELED